MPLAISSALLFISIFYSIKVNERRGITHSVSIVSAWCLITATIGYFVYGHSNNYYGGFYDLGIDDKQLQNTATLINILGLSTCWSGIAISLLQRKTKGSFTSKRPSPTIPVSPKLLRYILAFSAISIILLWHGSGWSSIFLRNEYIYINNETTKTAGNVLSTAAAIALGFLFFHPNSHQWQRAISAFLFIAIVIIYFSLASRRFPMLPALFAFGGVLGGAHLRNKKKILVLAFGITTSILLMPIPLSLRMQSQFGLFPFLESVFVAETYTQSDPLTILYNIFLSLPITAYTQDANNIDASSIINSITPLPSAFTTWGTISEHLRYSIYIPYSAAGELLSYGVTEAILYSIAIGAILSHYSGRIRNYPNARLPLTLAMNGGAILFSVFFLQYNLRSATRIIYYIIAANIAISLASKISIQKLKTKRETKPKGSQ